MLIRTPPRGPVVLAVAGTDWQIVDARDAATHEAVLVEFPVLVAVRPEPVARVVMPLVGEAYGEAIIGKCPELLDQSVVELLVPLARQKRFDRLADGLPRRLR